MSSGVRVWTSLRGHYSAHHLTPKIHFCATCNTHSPHTKVLRSLNPLEQQSKFLKISSKSYLLQSSKSCHRNHLSQVWARLWVWSIPPGTQLLSLCARENKLLALNVQWWDRRRIAVTDILVSTGRKWKETKESHSLNSFETQVGKLC